MIADYWLLGESFKNFPVNSWRPWSRKTFLCWNNSHHFDVFSLSICCWGFLVCFFFQFSHLPKRFAVIHPPEHLGLRESVFWVCPGTQLWDPNVPLNTQTAVARDYSGFSKFTAHEADADAQKMSGKPSPSNKYFYLEKDCCDSF